MIANRGTVAKVTPRIFMDVTLVTPGIGGGIGTVREPRLQTTISRVLARLSLKLAQQFRPSEARPLLDRGIYAKLSSP